MSPSIHTESKTSALRIAKLRWRLLALLYDTLLLAAILFCATMIYFFLIVVLSGEIAPELLNAQEGDVVQQLEPVEPGLFYIPTMLLIYIGFFTYFWTRTGQTLGMQAWKIKLINAQTGPISAQQCLLRLGVSWLSFFLAGLGFLTLLWRLERGTWHDQISQTQVIRLEPRR